MLAWFTADTHFGHEKIIEYESRPYPSAERMDEDLIERWNAVVAPGDLVYHLGDVGICPMKDIARTLHRLNGTKVLIRGNHDGKPGALLKAGFAAVFESATLKMGGQLVLLTHKPAESLDFWNIHGHVHSAWGVRPETRQICVSVENWQYKPVPVKVLTGLISKYTERHEEAKRPRGQES